MISLSDTLRLLLDGIGRSDEYEYYLSRFRKPEGTFSGILCPSLRITEEAPETLIFQLHVLSQLELPVGILLSGPAASKIEANLWRAGLKESWKNSFLKYPELTLEEAVFRAAEKYSFRFHLIRLRGPLRTEEGSEITVYNLNKPPVSPVQGSDKAILHISREIITRSPSMIHLSITSPADLLREIFTVKGAGTIVRKGSNIIRYVKEDLQRLDRSKIVTLLEQSFRKPLAATGFLDEITHAYIEENYRGAALLTERPEGLYLSKFSVDTMARGEGIAQEIWESMIQKERTENQRALFWRSRRTNSLNHWYKKQADGRQDFGDWTVFWMGLDIEKIPEVIRYSLSRPEDFRKPEN